MNDRPYRVVKPTGVMWSVRFVSAESAWGRIMSLNGNLTDNPLNRAKLLRGGWKVKLVEPAAMNLGETP